MLSQQLQQELEALFQQNPTANQFDLGGGVVAVRGNVQDTDDLFPGSTPAIIASAHIGEQEFTIVNNPAPNTP